VLATVALCAWLASSLLSSYAQEAKGGVVMTEKAVGAPTEGKIRPTPLPPAKTNLFKRFDYSGYLVEALRAENKRSLFDLSTPLDLRRNAADVFWNGRLDSAQPIILFRITPKR
jgi:hypothetical protein